MFTSMSTRVWFLALAMPCTLAAPASVRADYVSQSVILNQSNTLKDGVAYGSVLIEAYDGVGAAGGGLNAGEVRLTYSANVVADYASTDPTFGISHVGFNTDLGFKSGSITPPSGWKISNNKSLASFGKFTWDADGNSKGGSRPNPVTLLIGGLGTDATIGHFLFGSEGNGKNPPADGSVFFAMQVAGFTVNGQAEVTGHWVGGSTLEETPPPPGGSGDPLPTPEPTSWLLGAFGAGCICVVRRRQLRQKLAIS